MSSSPPNSSRWTTISVVVAGVFLLLAIWIRGVEGSTVTRPEVDPDEPPALQDAEQFLTPGARLRLEELDRVISEGPSSSWQQSSSTLFTLEGCPKLLPWSHSKEGLQLEAHLRELREGSSTDALGALTLIFQLARATEWDPGFLAHTEHAEKLATLLEEWLFARGERGVEDPLLFDATLSATLFYGRIMRIAYEAPIVGRNESSLQRARKNLERLVGGPGTRTALGRALQDQYPRAVALLEAEEDCCRGLADDCTSRFPDLNGECSE